jgi:CRP/FNR family transcriptional regulator, cyclic AMP receptor protein
MDERGPLSQPAESSGIPLLAKTKLFSYLDSDGLRELAGRAITRRYRRGEVVFREGDPGNWLFVVASGRMKVVVTSADGDEMVLAALAPPDTFGELALVDGGVRSATVEAVEASTLLVLTRAAFLDVLHEHPALVEGLLESLGGLIRRLTDQTSDLVFLDLPGRVAKLLLGLAGESEAQPATEHVIDVSFTQTEIANMVGGSRQSVNQILRNFESAGYIQTVGHSIRIVRADTLRRRAGYT